MLNKIKEKITDRIYQSCIKEYNDKVKLMTNPYLMWVVNKEKEESVDEESYPSLMTVYMEKCGKDFSLDTLSKTKDYVLFASNNGKISLRTFKIVCDYFDSHKDVDIIYFDEDIWAITDEDEDDGANDTEPMLHRICPWFKPCWSPDTLMSFNYFGNIFAIRRKAFDDIEWIGDTNSSINIYDFLLKATQRAKGIEHIEEILFHRYVKGSSTEDIEATMPWREALESAGKEYDGIKEAAIYRLGYKGNMCYDEKTKVSSPIYEVEGEPLVSIVIPSKDNLEVLKQCIRSIYKLTDYKHFEIIVIDNGSSATVRIGIENFKKECDFTYLYEPMEFNFSKMCNLGVSKSKGEYVLLLNDDMEVVQESWLRRMLGQASLSHVGAVGAKLLYPGTNLIQHAGITNTVSGPGHKLKQMEDNQCYYYGRDIITYDMIGVTAACLLVRRTTYDRFGGLYEGLHVAYNDVDFCFRLYEAGLYNVQRNDVVLYHHESLSRGDDMIDDAKFKRLMKEKDTLYSRHTKLYQRDPFNNDLINSGDPEYKFRNFEPFELATLTGYHDIVTPSDKKIPKGDKVNHALMIIVENCEKEKFKKINGKSYYFVKGWSYVRGMDNARFKLKMLFEDKEGRVYETPIVKQYREDVAKILKDEVETNLDLSGYCCIISAGDLPNGEYRIWITAKDMCSRLVIYRDSNATLEIND